MQFLSTSVHLKDVIVVTSFKKEKKKEKLSIIVTLTIAICTLV